MLPRLYRQAPLNSIWEGSGNIQCLDVLRALEKEPGTGAALWAELRRAGGHPDHAVATNRLHAPLHGDTIVEPAEARGFVEQLTLCLQGSVLLQAGSSLAAAFCRSRLGGAHGLAMGTLSADLPFADIIERALPTAV